MICEYIHLFLVITKNGVYLDLFAGPQSGSYDKNWSVKRVMELRSEGSPSIRHYAVCDKKRSQIKLLRLLKEEHQQKSHAFKIYKGDANEKVASMLAEAQISAKTACFCLIDQRTLECHWETVKAIAEYKKEGYKIEIFYFLAQGWLDRSWKSTKKVKRLRNWWGREDYEVFLNLKSVERAYAMCDRFCDELNYEYADPWAIYDKGSSGRTMYYMIHASDHYRAGKIMSDAYNSAIYDNSPEIGVQAEMFPRFNR